MDEQVMGNELISALNNIADAIRENAKANVLLAKATAGEGVDDGDPVTDLGGNPIL